MEPEAFPLAPPTALDLDARQFDDCERVIERGMTTFVEVGLALRTIRQLGLRELRARGYPTFEDYCAQRWGWSRRRGYQLMEAAEAVEHLQDCEPLVHSLPATERQARALTPLNDRPEAQRSVWSEAVRTGQDGKPHTGDLRRLVRERVAEQRSERQQRPAPAAAIPLLPIPCRIAVADATALPLDALSVDLIVTSPPYGLDKPYDSSEDLATEWEAFMWLWLREAHRVARPGGRLALNVPLDTTRGGNRPTYAQAVKAAEENGWTYRWTIVWADDHLGKSVARGSVDSPAAPHVLAPVEMIPVFYKGEWKRESEHRPDIDHDDWLAWTHGLWRFPGEHTPWEGHPAPFPEDLPRRLIQLLSFPGDTVLDPFLGSGTTLKEAVRLGREAIGFDISPEYVASAQRRIASAL